MTRCYYCRDIIEDGKVYCPACEEDEEKVVNNQRWRITY